VNVTQLVSPVPVLALISASSVRTMRTEVIIRGRVSARMTGAELSSATPISVHVTGLVMRLLAVMVLVGVTVRGVQFTPSAMRMGSVSVMSIGLVRIARIMPVPAQRTAVPAAVITKIV
jgi:hypothetical protein